MREENRERERKVPHESRPEFLPFPSLLSAFAFNWESGRILRDFSGLNPNSTPLFPQSPPTLEKTAFLWRPAFSPTSGRLSA